MKIAALVALLVSVPAFAAVDGAALEAATGAKVRMVRASVQWEPGKPMWQSNGTHVAMHWDLSLAQWRGTAYQNVPGEKQNLTDIGLTPVFRFQRDSALGFYLEAGIGVHLLSKLYDNDNRQLSTRFQFGDHIGVGYKFSNGWDTTLKIQHFSNGGIKRPNDGINFLVLKAGRSF